MTTATSGGGPARPPVSVPSTPEVTVRPTARVRPVLPVRLEEVEWGFPPEHPYVRRFWVAAIGAGAVSELLRLVKAGENGASLPLPHWLPVLLRSDLLRVEDGRMIVASRVPIVPGRLARRFSPSLAEQHRRALRPRRP